MGAIFAIVGDETEQSLVNRLQPMLDRSPYRGDPKILRVPGAVLAIQSLGWDASMVQNDQHVVCLHGFIGNWDELEAAHRNITGPEESEAARVARAYGVLGDKLFAKLRGEFSILIYHNADRSIKAVRDIIGARPLFYQKHEGLTFLASEIRQVFAGSGTPREINLNTCAAYLLNTYYQLADTLYRDVFRVTPAEILKFQEGQTKPSTINYWTLPKSEPRPDDSNYRELAEEARLHMECALRRSLPNEPFAVGLSGGLDSSAIWSILGAWSLSGDKTLSRAHAYSMVFPGMRCDEEQWTRLHETRYPGYYRYFNAANLRPSESVSLLNNLDQPPTGSVYQLYWFAEKILEDKAHRHLVDGLGGDELFGSPLGYLADELLAGHIWTVVSDLFHVRMPFGKDLFSIIRNDIIKPCIHRLGLHPGVWNPPHWLGHQFRHVHAAIEKRGFTPTYSTWTQDYLANVVAQHQSGLTLEAREQTLALLQMAPRTPLMDVDLVLFAHHLPPRARWQGFAYKALLREAISPITPVEITQRMSKSAFGEPHEREWPELKSSLMESDKWALAKNGCIDPSGVKAYFSPHFKGAKPSLNSAFLVRLLQLEFFLSKLSAG